MKHIPESLRSLQPTGDEIHFKTMEVSMNIKRIKKFTLVLMTVALIAWMPACDEFVSILSIGNTPQMEGLSGEIPIGLLYPITGRLAPTGVTMNHGFELALEEINSAQIGGVRLKFITEDDRGTVEGAVEAFNKLIHQDGVSVIIGPTTSSAAREVFPIAQENRVVAFSPTSAASGLSDIGDFIFRVTLTSDAHIPNSVRETQAKLGYRQVAIIHDEIDLVSQSGATAFRKALTENGVKILTTETFQTGETDFLPQLTRIMELNPDALFIAALPLDLPGIMIQARELGIPFSVPFIVPELSIDDVRTAGAAAEGLLSSASWLSTASTPKNRAFVQNYRATYGMEPNTWAAHSYATVYILAAAIGNAQSTDSEAIRDAMADIKDLDTILGNFSFDSVGDAVHDATILVVENGQFKVFE